MATATDYVIFSAEENVCRQNCATIATLKNKLEFGEALGYHERHNIGMCLAVLLRLLDEPVDAEGGG